MNDQEVFEWLAGMRIEPESCPKCGKRITEVTRGRAGESMPSEPMRFGCGCIADRYPMVVSDQDAQPDERLVVSPEVMALLAADFPEAAELFQVDPAWLKAMEYYQYPQRWVAGIDLADVPPPNETWLSVSRPVVWGPVPPAEIGFFSEVPEGEIRADERRLMCAAEGHIPVDITVMGDQEFRVRCWRCDSQWTLPREACPCAAARDNGVDCPVHGRLG